MKTVAKYAIGQKAYVIDVAEYIDGNVIRRIPMGKEVTVQGFAVVAKNEIRYNVCFDQAGKRVPMCWLDADRLAPRILDVAA